jgi:hypothetical protein
LLHALKANHRIALDFEQRILHEYLRNAPSDSHAGRWVITVARRSDRTMWRTGRLPARREAELINDLRFDRSDLVFVATSAEGPDKLLVSEESDYNAAIKNYLLRELGVTVLSIEDALARARDP